MSPLDGVRALGEEMRALLAGAPPTDPCAAHGHACRCPRPDIEAFVDRLNAEHHDQEERFRALFTRPEPPAHRERLAELDALTDRIDPLLQHLDDTWTATERALGRRWP
ncbi:hypothetical protein [Dactylosporangium salmoneum]|uniref:Hemerythrin-like domain-containing protein n=1 Tax=Dactylosporangium salmoneum TaxID=53361 RepID=A0ABN3FCU2_9ACTN